jgi:ATP-binding cassette subfamily B (MDR/TAP) protein 1
MTELMRHNAPEWYLIMFGCISSLIHGGVHPVIGILFGGIMGVSSDSF